ncbi:MAG: hypothetical protein ACI9VN_003482 [Patescibacteria group bacterium]|jgi:hypothetical protein
MISKFIHTVFFVLAFCSPSIIIAQGCCSGGAPISGNLDLGQSSPHQLSVRLTYDYNRLGDVIFKSKIVNDDTRARITNTGILRLTYALNQRIAFGGLFSYVEQVEKVNSITSSRTSGKGLGDLTFFAQYSFLKKKRYSMDYALGIKTPTGATDRKNEDSQLNLNPDLQPGTGAWDWFNIIQFGYRDLFRSKINLSARSSYRFNGKSTRFNNQQYRFGNELQLFLGLSRDFFLKTFMISPQLIGNYRNTDPDEINDFETPNTGGHWIYFIPGLKILPKPNWSIGLFAELPVYRNLSGIQLTTSYKLSVNLSHSFSLKKNKAPAPFKLKKL